MPACLTVMDSVRPGHDRSVDHFRDCGDTVHAAKQGAVFYTA